MDLTPTRDDRFSFGLWTVGWQARLPARPAGAGLRAPAAAAPGARAHRAGRPHPDGNPARPRHRGQHGRRPRGRGPPRGRDRPGRTASSWFPTSRASAPQRPHATAHLSGLRLATTTPANLARAAVEGMLCGLADGLDALRRQGVAVGQVLLIGGGARPSPRPCSTRRSWCRRPGSTSPTVPPGRRPGCSAATPSPRVAADRAPTNPRSTTNTPRPRGLRRRPRLQHLSPTPQLKEVGDKVLLSRRGRRPASRRAAPPSQGAYRSWMTTPSSEGPSSLAPMNSA
jgi:carbohydrate kinase of FGGY family protein